MSENATLGAIGRREPSSRLASEGSRPRELRRPPRAVDDRKPDDVVRCRMCDWQLINGEAITRTRPCCPYGLAFDLKRGLTLLGADWRPPETQCMWVRVPDLSNPLELQRRGFQCGCTGEIARGVHAIYPDICPKCKRPVVLLQRSTEELGPELQPGETR